MVGQAEGVKEMGQKIINNLFTTPVPYRSLKCRKEPTLREIAIIQRAVQTLTQVSKIFCQLPSKAKGKDLHNNMPTFSSFSGSSYHYSNTKAHIIMPTTTVPRILTMDLARQRIHLLRAKARRAQAIAIANK